jgi:formylglycine-generating enzyme required for sulfatase activity
MIRLTQKQRKEIVDILKPALGSTHQERFAFLTLALSGTSVLDRIEYSGSSLVFLSNLIDILTNYGKVEKDKEALWAVLEAVRESMGMDYQERIEALRPIFEKPSIHVSSNVESQTVKSEDTSGIKQYPSRPTLNRSSDQHLSNEVTHTQLVQCPPLEERPAKRQITPIHAAREYVENMRPVPPDLPKFYMAPCLVSNELYYYFVCEKSDWLKAQGNADRNYLKHWVKGEPRSEDMRLPITNISLRAARAFAEWLSEVSFQKVHLPKLEEWQIAASAGQAQWFEEAIAAGRVNYSETACHLHAVDAFKPNPYGIRDLIGQAFDMTFPDDNSSKPSIVGGCYHNTEKQLRASLHGDVLSSDKTCRSDTSFRCVRSD